MHYGPNHDDVARIIARAAQLSLEDAHAIVNARLAWAARATRDDGEQGALREAFRAARRSRRLDAYLAARADAADAFRVARRGEVGPWLIVAAAVSDAACAAVVGDLLDIEVYETLYRPWRAGVAGAELMAFGPSQFGVPRRRKAATRSS